MFAIVLILLVLLLLGVFVGVVIVGVVIVGWLYCCYCWLLMLCGDGLLLWCVMLWLLLLVFLLLVLVLLVCYWVDRQLFLLWSHVTIRNITRLASYTKIPDQYSPHWVYMGKVKQIIWYTLARSK